MPDDRPDRPNDVMQLESQIQQSIDGDTKQKLALAVVEEKAAIENTSVLNAFDPTAIIAIINAIFSAIQNCPGANVAERVVSARERPRGFAAFVVKRALRRQFNRTHEARKDARNWTLATFQAMTEADGEDVRDVLESAEANG